MLIVKLIGVNLSLFSKHSLTEQPIILDQPLILRMSRTEGTLDLYTEFFNHVVYSLAQNIWLPLLNF